MRLQFNFEISIFHCWLKHRYICWHSFCQVVDVFFFCCWYDWDYLIEKLAVFQSLLCEKSINLKETIKSRGCVIPEMNFCRFFLFLRCLRVLLQIEIDHLMMMFYRKFDFSFLFCWVFLIKWNKKKEERVWDREIYLLVHWLAISFLRAQKLSRTISCDDVWFHILVNHEREDLIHYSNRIDTFSSSIDLLTELTNIKCERAKQNSDLILSMFIDNSITFFSSFLSLAFSLC